MKSFKLSWVLILTLATMLPACASRSNYSDAQTQTFSVTSLAKSDVDMVFDIYVERVFSHLRTLATKLYRRNPAELRKSGLDSIEEGVAVIFDAAPELARKRTHDKLSTDAIRLAFQPDYAGDRVFAFMLGLRTMLDAAYENQKQFFMLDELDPQKLYNSARNIEVANWMLTQSRYEAGQHYLLSYSAADGQPNLSFERLIGKLIAVQDVAAEVISQRTHRTIKIVIQRVAAGIFLPI